MPKSVVQRVFEFIVSLRLAIFVLIIFALSLATATVLESLYDTPTAQYWVYRSFGFRFLLGLLGVNIFAVALSRYPWEKKHIPFLLAHAGILILILGAWMTEQFGIDGNMRITEGESSPMVEESSNVLYLMKDNQVESFAIPWRPPHVFTKPSYYSKFDVTLDRYLTHAEPKFSFIPNQKRTGLPFPALELNFKGGPMNISQNFWIWGGDPSFTQVQAGPAKILLIGPHGEFKTPATGPVLIFRFDLKGDLHYLSISSHSASQRQRRGHQRQGKFLAQSIQGSVIDPGWKGNIKITVNQYIPNAAVKVSYEPSQLQYGEQASPSALHFIKGYEEGWVGLGDRVNLGQIDIAYLPKRKILPFSLKLVHFQIDRYAGTQDPASYSSKVMLEDTHLPISKEPIIIQMNEPLQHGGFTFYQASYIDEEPRPLTTILSVNRDPGRWVKYLGSILLVSGVIFLFLVKYMRKPKV